MADGADRQTVLTLDLGDEQTDLVRIMASEALSQHFTVVLDLLAPHGEIDFLQYLGRPTSVEVLEDDQHQRYFHGVLVDAEFLDHTDKRGSHYRVMLKPAAFLHSQGSNYRIFQDKTTQEIIETILGECKIEFDFKQMQGSTPTRAYCVQYGESNFAFVSRLMEEDGLYYFYAHTENDHVLTVCNAPASHKEGAASPLIHNEKAASIAMVDSAGRFAAGHGQYVFGWHERVSSGAEQKVTLRDYDFMTPNVPVKGEASGDPQHDSDAIEMYGYPARSYLADVSQKRSEALLEGRRANRRTYSGESSNAAIACGWTFELTEHKLDRHNCSYLLTHVQHTIVAEQYSSDLGYVSETRIDFEAIPAATPWRAPLSTRRPIVLGPETAVVTGPSGEEIYTDKYGRVKVQFHWDREGERNEKSSCWVRVSQTGGLGNVILPRVGHEVLVDFIDGDPDRPIVVGRVFNENCMPHYDLPDHKTRAVWRTKSYKENKPTGAKKDVPADDPKGGNPGANEIRFEDAPGSEEMYVYAQRDMKTLIRRDEKHYLGNDLEIDVGQNRTMTIGVDDTVTVGDNRSTTIGKNETRDVADNRETTIGKNETLEVGKKIVIDAGTEIEITAQNKITLTVGGSSITIKPTSIEVKTTTLKTNAATMAQHEGGGSKVQLNPVGVKINGAMVFIN